MPGPGGEVPSDGAHMTSYLHEMFRNTISGELRAASMAGTSIRSWFISDIGRRLLSLGKIEGKIEGFPSLDKAIFSTVFKSL